VFWSPAIAQDVAVLAPSPPHLTLPPPELNWPPERARKEAEDGEHVLLGGSAAVQLWRVDPSCPDAGLAFVIPLDANLPARLASALDLWRRLQGEAPRQAMLSPQRRRRLVDGLRALDARAAGASYREIARVLYGADRVPDGNAWKSHDLRSRTMRLVADATALMRGGYRELLRLTPTR